MFSVSCHCRADTSAVSIVQTGIDSRAGTEQATWDDLTFSADIAAAPRMLNGELRDYQLKARGMAVFGTSRLLTML